MTSPVDGWLPWTVPPHPIATRVTACPAGQTYDGPRWPWLCGSHTPTAPEAKQ